MQAGCCRYTEYCSFDRDGRTDDRGTQVGAGVQPARGRRATSAAARAVANGKKFGGKGGFIGQTERPTEKRAT